MCDHKIEYDKYGNITYQAANDNSWWRRTLYDERGNMLYYEDYAGFWVKKEYDEDNNEIRYQNYLGVDTSNC